MAQVALNTVEDATALMETEARNGVFIRGHRLRLEYDLAPGGGGGGGGGWGAGGDDQQWQREARAAPQDWICDMCNAMNFARRLECFSCHTTRPAQPRTVDISFNEPSCVLRVSGLEPQTGSAELLQLFYSVAPVVDCRLIRDKYTRQPRGFAFVEFRSVAEAGKAMQACQGAAPPGQEGGVRITYARSKEQDQAIAAAAAAGGRLPGFVSASGDPTAAGGGDGGGGVGGDDDPFAAWAPKEFDELGVVGAGGDGQAAQEQQQQQPRQGEQQQQGGEQQQGGQQQQQGEHQSGFQYDPSTGYYYDPASGYYYDQATGLYYHATTQQWLRLDTDTGQFVAAESAPQSGEQQQQQQEGEEAAPPVQGPQLPAGRGVGPALGHGAYGDGGFGQQQQQQQPNQHQGRVQGAVPRRVATIGAAPQLNAQGLLMVVAVEEEREKEERRRQKLLQQKAEASGRRVVVPQVVPTHAQGGAMQPPGPPAAPQPAVAAKVADSSGSVQGVVYQSKWQQRNRAKP